MVTLVNEGKRQAGFRRMVGLALVAVLLASFTPTASATDRTEYLIHLLQTSDTFRVRTQAALSLGRVQGDERVVKALSGALRDPHPAVRSAAASSLERLGDPSALPALRYARKDRDATVRKAVRRAITRLEAIARTRPQSSPLPQGGSGPARFYISVATPKSKASGVRREALAQAREALVRQLAEIDGVVVAPDRESPASAKRALHQKGLLGYRVESSVVRLEESSQGTRAVISLILATYPGRDMRAMLQGAATVPGGQGAEAQAQAIEGAITGALRRLPQALEASAQRDGG